MWIKQTVEKLCRHYKTNDPFELAQCMGAMILFEQLGTVRGYYCRSYKQKVIHINVDENREQQAITCAHELGHSILHPNANTPYLRANTLYSIDKLEVEANRFMVQLLIPDFEMVEYFLNEYTRSQIAKIRGIPEYLIDYRMQTMNVK